MHWTFLQWQRTVAGLLAATALVGCHGENSLGPSPRGSFPEIQTAPSAAADRGPDLTGCEQLQVPAGSHLVVKLYAVGVQIYRWNGAAWAFVAPSADLFPNAHARGKVGTHYAGPTWESVSGSKVVGSVAARCTPDPTAIQWLLLNVVSNDGPGIFRGVTHIQRIHTVAGLAPSQPGSAVGETANVPYTTEYLFYRAP